ncbi:hypothetical protein D3C76_912180 [compost metagenome]
MLGPAPVVHRGDRHGGGDAVADQLGEGIAVLEQLFLGAVALLRAGAQVVFRPHAAHLPLAAVVQREHGGVEIAEGVQIDEAGADQRMAVVDPLRHLAGKTAPDEEDAPAFEYHFAVAPEHMLAAIEANHEAGLEADACSHSLLSSSRPFSAINRPALKT